MQQAFSPKQVARAIGASESSVKRWCDRGILPSTKTGGGHRRVLLSGLLEFVRAEDRTLVSPVELGLPPEAGVARHSVSSAAEQFRSALAKGDYAICRRLVFDLYLAKHSIAKICDEVLSPAMSALGDGWCKGEVEVYEERRGCEFTLRLIHELRPALNAPRSDAPLAIGASLENDPYRLPTRMVELSLLECGWNAISLGCGIPISSLKQAVIRQRPRLLWLSISTLQNREQFVEQYQDLFSICDELAVAIGGRGLDDDIRKRIKYSSYCESLQRLETFAQALYPSGSKS